MDRLSASACLVIVSDLDHTMDPSAVTVHPFGVEKTLYKCIHELKEWYGDKQGKKFRVCVDCVLSTQIGSSTWLVNLISGSNMVMCSAVVQPLERSVLRKVMVHMGYLGCMYNKHDCKDRKWKTIQHGCSRLISDTIPDLSSSRAVFSIQLK